MHALHLLNRAHANGWMAAQIAAYGACVMAHKDAIERGVCEKEFRALQQCFAKSVRRSLR